MTYGGWSPGRLSRGELQNDAARRKENERQNRRSEVEDIGNGKPWPNHSHVFIKQNDTQTNDREPTTSVENSDVNRPGACVYHVS